MTQQRNEWRRKAYLWLAPDAWPHQGLSPANLAIAWLIVASVVFAIAESEPGLLGENAALLRSVELSIAAIFSVEYALRLWVSAENPKYGPGLSGRLRYMRSPAAIIDLLALSPVLFMGFGGEAFLLRLLRLLRVLRLARLGRFSSALTAIADAIRSRAYELTMSAVIAGFLLLGSSTLLYVVENEGQPDAFGSIPRAMWWSIATLTTVGYGDVTPLTVVGRLLAGVTAVTGIGLIAMPTGILAAAFSDALQKEKQKQAGDDEPPVSPSAD